MIKKIIITIFLLFILVGCSQKKEKKCEGRCEVAAFSNKIICLE